MMCLEIDHQWFGESFNDYVCLINLYNSKILSEDTLIGFLHRSVIAPHYKSKINTAPNNAIAEKYWSDKDYEKRPYRRGTIVAFYLNNQIRLNTTGPHTLRDVLLALFRKYKENVAKGQGDPITVDDFTAAVSVYLPAQVITNDIQRYMINGELLDLRTVKLCQEFTV